MYNVVYYLHMFLLDFCVTLLFAVTAMKHLPMGQMPILEIGDGKVYHQSKAIARFVAKKGNLYGSDDIEAMEIDATVETIDDLRIGKKKKKQYMCFISKEE